MDSKHRSNRSPSPRSFKKRHDSRSPSRERARKRHDSRSLSRERTRKRHDSRSPNRSSKRRHHSRSRSPNRHDSRSRSSRYSTSSKSEHRSRRHRSKSPSESRHKRRDSSSSSMSDSEDDRKKRHHKKHKKHKKSKKKSKSKLSVGDQWGKYGIIHESDIFTKEPEFQAWLIEVKNANVETLNNNKRKEMFLDFMEDYNTATMPHEKFYNLGKWERRQEAIRMGEDLPLTTGDGFNFRDDEERLKAQHRLSRQTSRQPTLKLSEEQIKELTRINRERVEADRMRKMGLKPKEGMGVRYEYVEDPF